MPPELYDCASRLYLASGWEDRLAAMIAMPCSVIPESDVVSVTLATCENFISYHTISTVQIGALSNCNVRLI